MIVGFARHSTHIYIMHIEKDPVTSWYYLINMPQYLSQLYMCLIASLLPINFFLATVPQQWKSDSIMSISKSFPRKQYSDSTAAISVQVWGNESFPAFPFFPILPSPGQIFWRMYPPSPRIAAHVPITGPFPSHQSCCS